MGNHVDILDDPVGKLKSVLVVQIHPVVRGEIPQTSQAFSIVGVNSVEHKIERRIRFSSEAQNSVGLVRPKQFATVDLPPESPRMTQPLSLCQVLPPSLQLCLRFFQNFIGLLKRVCSLSAPSIQDVMCFAGLLSGSALCHLRPFAGEARCGSSNSIRARMSRFSNTMLGATPIPPTTTSTMARAKSSALIT